MKRSLCLFLLIASLTCIHAQTIPSQNKKRLPAFDILQADGTHFKVTDLKKGMPVMLVYFDPDCDHCVMFIQQLLRNINGFNNVEIVMITYVPIQSVKNFITKVGLNKYPQIKVGTEGTTFIVRYHYDIAQFPYLALHDNKGMLIKAFESDVPLIPELENFFSK